MTNLARIAIGDTPPLDTGALWLSTALHDVRISPARGDRQVVISPTLTAEGQAVQECSVWFHNGEYHMLYTGGFSGNSLCYAHTTHPLDVAWTKAGRVLGQGAGGWNGVAYHSSVFVEGDTLYCTFTNDSAIHLATASIDSPTAWTYVGIILPSTNPPMGNSIIFVDPTRPAAERYVLWFDTSFDNWQDGFATAPAASGPYTLKQMPIAKLWPDHDSQSGGLFGQGGGGWFARENNEWVQFFHAGPKVSGSLPTEMYRAFSTDLVNWRIDNNAQPIIRRSDSGEGDQIADAFIVTSPTGQRFIFWEGFDNVAPRAVIYCAPLQPVLKRFDGHSWVEVLASSDTGTEITAPRKSAVFTKTTDFNTSSATFVDMMTFYGLPSGPCLVADVALVGTNGTTQNQIFQIVCVETGQTVPLGQMYVPASATQAPFGGKAFFNHLTADKLYTFKLQVKVGGNTFYCRPASFPALERCVVEVRDAAFPTPAA